LPKEINASKVETFAQSGRPAEQQKLLERGLGISFTHGGKKGLTYICKIPT
jgi:hypothetical protein